MPTPGATGSERSAVLSLRDVTAGYGKVEIVRRVSLDLRPAEIIGLIAPNGAGKSTLLRSIAGFCDVQAGAVTYRTEDDGVADLVGWSTSRRVREGIRYVPERADLFGRLSVVENLKIAALAVDRNWSDRILDDEITPLFSVIADRYAERAENLSGGQRRALSLAMALVQRPRVLLVDEPFAGLAPAIVETLSQSLLQIRDRGLAMILIDHNLPTVLRTSDRIIVLRLGDMIMDRPRAEVSEDIVLEAFRAEAI